MGEDCKSGGRLVEVCTQFRTTQPRETAWMGSCSLSGVEIRMKLFWAKKGCPECLKLFSHLEQRLQKQFSSEVIYGTSAIIEMIRAQTQLQTFLFQMALSTALNGKALRGLDLGSGY